MSNETNQIIINNLNKAIESGNRAEIYSHIVDFIHNVDVDRQVDFIVNKFKDENKNVSKEDVEGFLEDAVIRINKKEVSEDEIAMSLMGFIINKSSADEVLSKALQVVDKSHEVVKGQLKELIAKKNVFYNFIVGEKRKSVMKEVVGWFAGLVESESEEYLDKLTVYGGDGKIHERKTLKNLLNAINKRSITPTVPFKANYSKFEKLEMDMINVYSRSLRDNVEMDAFSLIMNIPKSNLVKGTYSENFMIDNKEKIINIAKSVVGLNLRELSNRGENLMKYSYIQAPSNQIDALSFNGDKVQGMSITSDPTTRIEQNQFFRHAFKSMIIGMEIKKVHPDGCNNVSARNIARDLKLEVKIKGGSDSYTKPIGDMSFGELVRYYFQQKGKKQQDFEKISGHEMDIIIEDVNNHADFVFYGESFSYARMPLKEELAGMVMLSYVNNLKNIGNISIDSYEDVFNFLKDCVSAKFNECENNKNYIKFGLDKAIDFIIDENTIDKYNEGNCYKDGREVIYGSIKALMYIVDEKLEKTNNIECFVQELNNFLMDNGVDKEKRMLLTKKLIEGKIGIPLRSKCDKIKKGDSETGQELENLIAVTNGVEMKIKFKSLSEQIMSKNQDQYKQSDGAGNKRKREKMTLRK